MQLQIQDKKQSGGAVRFNAAAPGGYVTLLTVLLVTMLGLGLAFSALLISGNFADTTLLLEESKTAHAYADACTEQGLHMITQGERYAGSATKQFSEGSCDYSVSSISADSSALASTGTVSDVVRKVSVVVNTQIQAGSEGTTTSITGTVWREPGDF